MTGGPYREALVGIGVDVLVEEDSNNYQGDWVALVVDRADYGNEIGFIQQGYGSCSGCDAWQAASNLQDRLDLLQDMITGIKWFDSVESLVEFLSADHEDQWWGHHEPATKLLERSLEALKGLNPVDNDLYSAAWALRKSQQAVDAKNKYRE